LVSFAFDVSAITGDWTFRYVAESLTGAKNALLAFEESQDGFVSDIRQRALARY
jgi:hypothetical protein